MKILVLRFSSIGDIVLTTPVVRCLKNQIEDVEIHYLTKTFYKNILAPNPYITKVWTFDKDIKEVVTNLKQEKFDWIIDLHNNLRTRHLRWKLGVPTKAFNKINIEKWLMVNLKINRLPNVHIVDRYLKTIEHLGIKNDGAGLDYFFPTDFKSTIQKPTTPYITFAIGAQHATKRLPTPKIIKICKTLSQPVLLLGGPTDKTTGEIIDKATPSNIINLCGKCSLHESAWLVQHAEKVMTHDTGMMHIAAAFKKEIISIWGNTIPEFGMYPYYPKGQNLNTSIEVKGLSCRPCSKIGYKTCPKGHFKCMEKLGIG